MWKGDQPDGSPYSNREFVLFLNGGSVHLSSTPVSRQHRGHIYLDTPRGAGADRQLSDSVIRPWAWRPDRSGKE